MPMDIQTLAQTLEQMAPGMAQAVLSLPPDQQQVLLMIFQEEEAQQPGMGVQAVLDTLMQALSESQGGAPIDGGVPGMPPAPPPVEQPVGPEMMPPEMMGVPPEMMGGAPTQGVPPEMQAGAPTQAPTPLGYAPGEQVQQQPKKKKLPKYELRDLDDERYADEPPTLRRIEEDARLGRERWKHRDERIEDDLLCFRGEMQPVDLYGNPIEGLEGRTMYARTTSFNWVKKVASLATWTNDRVEFDLAPRDDSTEYKDAADHVEEWMRHTRRYDEDCWFARSEVGDPQPPLPNHEAEMMALLGGLGWMWRIDPKDKRHPYKYEPVPVNQIFPMSHSTTRQFLMPLNQARAEYREVDEYYQLDDEDGQPWGEDLEVRITCWSDRWGIRHAIIWSEEGGAGNDWHQAQDKERDRFIKKPDKRHDLGFPFYNMRIWSSVPAGPTPNTKNNYTEFVGMGVLTRVRRTFAVVDMVANFTIRGALRASDPATLQTHMPGTNLDDVQPLDLEAGGRNFGFQGDDVKPLVFTVTGNPDGQSMVQMLINEMADIMPPAMSGGQVGTSGFQQMQASEISSATTVGPLVDALERTYQTIFAQRAQLALRFSKNKKAKDSEYFSSYDYRSSRPGRYGSYGEMTPEDIEMAGWECEVRYKRLSITEEAALANMVVQLTNAHLMSVDTALRRMGVRQPDREWLKILQDGAMLDPNVLKGLVGTAIMSSGNEILMMEWEKAGMLQAMAGGAGSQPGQPGSPSAPNPAGMAAPVQPADIQQPGASSPVAA